MRILDTSVILRLLLNDDPLQSAQAARVFRQGLKEDQGLMLPDIVIAECVWTLKVRGFSKTQVAEWMKAFLSEDHLLFENRERMAQALSLFEDGHDFGDALIAATAMEFGAEGIISFDRDFVGLEIPWIDPAKL